MSPPNPCRIDAAVAEDVPEILAMISELAEFELLSHEAVATPADLTAALFGPRPYAEVLLARSATQVSGFALFFHNYSTFKGKPGIYLEDLYVRPAFRGLGHGKALLTRVAQLAVERGCGRYEWSVLDWNQTAIDFYRGLGARPMNEWTVMRVDGEALASLGKRGE